MVDCLVHGESLSKHMFNSKSRQANTSRNILSHSTNSRFDHQACCNSFLSILWLRTDIKQHTHTHSHINISFYQRRADNKVKLNVSVCMCMCIYDVHNCEKHFVDEKPYRGEAIKLLLVNFTMIPWGCFLRVDHDGNGWVFRRCHTFLSALGWPLHNSIWSVHFWYSVLLWKLSLFIRKGLHTWYGCVPLYTTTRRHTMNIFIQHVHERPKNKPPPHDKSQRKSRPNGAQPTTHTHLILMSPSAGAHRVRSQHALTWVYNTSTYYIRLHGLVVRCVFAVCCSRAFWTERCVLFHAFFMVDRRARLLVVFQWHPHARTQ